MRYYYDRQLRTASDTLWLDSMSPSPQYTPDNGRSSLSQDANPTTVAVFSPQSLSHSPSSRQRSKIIVQQQSPLLASTPPQITRALAYSHPFLLPLNRAVGLVTWTTDDPWESFLLLTTFGATVLYGDILLRWAGPCMIAMILIVGIYSRRFSLLSPTARRNRDFAKGKDKETVRKAHPEQQKGFDEIVDTLQLFTRRCNILIDPLIDLLDYLSAQQSEGSPTNKTALNRLLLRLLLLTPIWAIFAYPRVGLITTRRAVLTVGTLILSWHSRSARVSRAILWRSATVRRLCSRLTGLDLESASISGPPTASIQSAVQPLAASVTSKPSISPSPSPKTESTGVRFTFTLWENQRRWLGLGWTNSLFAYERAAWTDEHLNAVPSKEALELPEVESGDSRWQWVEGSEWHVEGEGGSQGSTKNDKKRGKSRDAGSWIYYDSKVCTKLWMWVLDWLHTDQFRLLVARRPSRTGRLESVYPTAEMVSRRRARRSHTGRREDIKPGIEAVDGSKCLWFSRSDSGKPSRPY